jgi:hypothetical protein
MAGGMFVPTKNTNNPFTSSVYFTTTSDRPEKYSDIFFSASKLAQNGQFLIRYDNSLSFDEWDEAELFKSKKNNQEKTQLFKIPRFEIYKFDPRKETFHLSTIEDLTNLFIKKQKHLIKKIIPKKLKEHFVTKFSDFELLDLRELYVNRLFFDGYLNLTYLRGAPLDIDIFVQSKKTTKLSLLEVKEKDVSKRDPKGFGMDLRRIESLTKLSKTFKVQAFYVVRHVDNQINRNFIDWRIIELEKFKESILSSPIIEGGFGMRSRNSSNPTKVCKIEYFSVLR